MPVGDTAFSTSVFSVDVAGVARHPNPVTCVVRGRRGPLTVAGEGQSVTADIVIIRPGIEHHIVCGEGGFTVMYLDGARWPGPHTLAQRLEGRLGELVLAGMKLDPDAKRELAGWRHQTRVDDAEYAFACEHETGAGQPRDVGYGRNHRRQPECSATTPPERLCQDTREKPAARIISAKAFGFGNLRIDSTR